MRTPEETMTISERLNTLTAAQLKEARDWINDCQWRDIDDASELTDMDVVRGIARHYDGGWSEFIANGSN